MPENKNEHLCCPKCGATEVRILDKGFKRLLRLICGSSRMFCRVCRITWRVNRPKSTHVIGKKNRCLPVYEEDEWVVISLPEGAWHKNARELLITIEHLLNIGTSRIKIDFSLPQAFSTAAFGTLLKAYKCCQDKGAELFVCKVPDDIREAFTLTKLDFLLDSTE